MGEEVKAATTSDASVTDSATVETSTVDNSSETSEKTEISQEGQQDGQAKDDSQPREEDGQSVPKARLDEVIKERNELRELKTKVEADKLEQDRMKSMTPEQQVQSEQAQTAQKALKKLGFMTQDDFSQAQKQEQAKTMFISEMNRLEGEHDGKDGKPKFVPTEIAEFMDEQMAKGQQITDPETAYKLKYFDAIVDARAKSQKSTAYAEKQSGGVQEVNDTRSAELEAASKSGDISGFLKKYAGMPKNN